MLKSVLNNALGPQRKKTVKIRYEEEHKNIFFELVGSPRINQNEVVEALKGLLRW